MEDGGFYVIVVVHCLMLDGTSTFFVKPRASVVWAIRLALNSYLPGTATASWPWTCKLNRSGVGLGLFLRYDNLTCSMRVLGVRISSKESNNAINLRHDTVVAVPGGVIPIALLHQDLMGG